MSTSWGGTRCIGISCLVWADEPHACVVEEDQDESGLVEYRDDVVIWLPDDADREPELIATREEHYG